jgi:GDP-L-fucose synthase
MRIFVTGARGMVGRNLLADPRARAHVIDAPPREVLDLRDAAAVRTYLAANRPDLVIHLAAVVGGIQANINEPYRFLLENLQLTTAVIDGARAAGVGALLNVGSSCMYPRDLERPLSTDLILSAPLEPTNEGYALAKIASAKMTEFIRREDPGLRYKTLIPCNLYGPFDDFHPIRSHMIPAIVRKLVEAKAKGSDEVEIWGDGAARREFMYAGDLADFIWSHLERLEELPDLMNVGVGDDHTVNDYYRIIAEVVGYAGGFRHDLSKPAGMMRKLLDVSQQRGIGWSPATSLQEGVRLTFEHFKTLPA